MNGKIVNQLLEIQDVLNNINSRIDKVEKAQRRNYNKIHKLHNDIGYFVITGEIMLKDKKR